MKNEPQYPINVDGEQATNRLFGRERDLETVTTMLRSFDCRLVTLTGPGGIGKTCLARQVAQQLQPDFDDQVYSVPLQSITNPQVISHAVAEQLGLRSYSQDDPSVALLRFLKSRRLLLVLDNFEHILEASEFVVNILEHTSQIKLLITSREVLNLQQEWVWPVRGIAYPTDESVSNIFDFAAVKMFDSCARRINPSFDIKHELADVIQISKLVEGSPLAIELATSWLKLLTCQDILAELRQDIDILTTRMRDVPVQHRSIRAVFDRSWNMLTADEQRVLMSLSLFRGSFTREAANAIDTPSLEVLATLIDKSLLYHQQNGRYQFHELFRQYVHGHLLQDNNAVEQVEQAMITYYRDFLALRMDEIWASRQREAIREVAAELPNIRTLSHKLILTDNPSASRRAVHVLSETHQFLGYYREAERFIRMVIKLLEEVGTDELAVEYKHLQAEMQNNLGWVYIRLGEFEKAEEVIAQAQTTYERHHLRLAIGFASDPRLPLAELKGIQGNHSTVKELSEAAYTDAMDRGDLLNGSVALYILTTVALMKEDYHQAQVYVEDAVALTQKKGNRWFLAYCLNQQGHICREQGDYLSAQQHYEESYQIRESFDDPEGQAVALNHLATLAMLQDEHERTIELLQRSLAIYQRLEDRGGLFTAHTGISIAYTALTEFEKARDHLIEAVQIANDAQATGWWLSLCEAAGEFFAMTGSMEYGLELISLVLYHPETKSITRHRAEHWLKQMKHNMPSTTQLTDLSAVTRQLEQKISIHTWQELPQAPDQPGLIEPLTERELEILGLLADGLTNQEIADQLVLEVGTVKSHNYNIFGKLDVKNRGQAVKRARELNLL